MEQSLTVYHLCNLFSSHSPILACQTVEYSLFNLHIVNNLKCANFAQVVTKVRKNTATEALWKRIISENFLFWLQKNTKSRLTSLTKFHIWTFIHIFVPQRNKIMETSKTYNRTINLLDKYTKFIKSINTEDIGNNLTLDKLIELKSILSDINNIMTFVSTKNWGQ